MHLGRALESWGIGLQKREVNLIHCLGQWRQCLGRAHHYQGFQGKHGKAHGGVREMRPGVPVKAAGRRVSPKMAAYFCMRAKIQKFAIPLELGWHWPGDVRTLEFHMNPVEGEKRHVWGESTYGIF